MAAPKGNKFWKLRSKHGKNKIFATPEQLWNAACEYFDWCDNNSWHRKEAIKSGNSAGEIISIPTQRPYSLSGFMIYSGVNHSFWSGFKKAGHEEYFDTITRIEAIIETQQFEGAVVGAFNANIIARKLGLSDKTELSGRDGESIKANITNTHRVIFEDYTAE